MTQITEIAQMIDHSILHPTLTDADLEQHCAIADTYQVATACVKPYHVRRAAALLKDSKVEVCAVIGFPHGNSTKEIKQTEALQVIRDGASEVDMVINTGKVLQHDWDYVHAELHAVNTICKANNAMLKVIFETDFLTEDADKIKLCQLCNENQVDFVKTSTGFGFVKGKDGKYSYAGATEHNLKLMRKYADPHVQVKAAGGVRTLDQLMRVKELGVTRVGATATEPIMKEARQRFGK